MGPGALASLLATLRVSHHPDLLIGTAVSDDAAVFRLSDEQALVSTVDFFPPIVDDPYHYGAIAAANALSDVYAMGGRPLFALSVAAFPADIPEPMMQAILQGGADKVAEAGAVLAGGHTVYDREPKYGLCVTGIVEIARVTPKTHAQPGDILVLTKPLGTGIITTAMKRDCCDQSAADAAIESMLALNGPAAMIAQQAGARSMTDVTGFGLLGHAAEIARKSGVGMVIDAAALPLLPGAYAFAQAEIAPGGLFTNKSYLEQQGMIHYADSIDPAHKLLLFDPQTSGGLLIALSPTAITPFEQHMAVAGHRFWRIGHVVAGNTITIVPKLGN